MSDSSCLSSYFLTFLLEGGTCLAGIVAILACATYWHRVRSLLSSWLLAGAVGQTLAGLGVLAVGFANIWTATHSRNQIGPELSRRILLLQRISIGVLILAFCSALVFSLSLLLVFRRVGNRKNEISIHAGES